MQTTCDRINCYLHYGYIPDPHVAIPEPLLRWLRKKKERSPGNDDQGLMYYVTKLEKVLKKAFKDAVCNDHNKTHIVPLSGGLDSRGVLVGLMELVDPKNITTVTFGTPASYDYRKAKQIARDLDISWMGVDLSPGKWSWNTADLVETAYLSERPTWLFDTTVNYIIQRHFGKDAIYWSGFMGDSLGRMQPVSAKATTWAKAKSLFCKKNAISSNYILTPPGYDPETPLPELPYVSFEKLDYYSQLNYFIRQQCLTKHIYSPQHFDVRYPFLHYDWISCLLDAPMNYRQNQKLYTSTLEHCWPRVFNINRHLSRDSARWKKVLYGNKSDILKVRAKKISPMLGRVFGPIKNVNYVDFDHALRNRKDLKKTVFENIMDLKSRKLIDFCPRSIMIPCNGKEHYHPSLGHY